LRHTSGDWHDLAWLRMVEIRAQVTASRSRSTNFSTVNNLHKVTTSGHPANAPDVPICAYDSRDTVSLACCVSGLVEAPHASIDVQTDFRLNF
jgi:hypothetical protein